MGSKETKKSESKKDNKSIPVDTNNEKNRSADQERNGVLPEGMDFKKFLGCGG